MLSSMFRETTPRRTIKTSESVALEIVRNIAALGLNPGDRLPQESDLLAQYKVSRSSLREAMRLLEVQGIIVIRPGPGAGTVVGEVLPGNLGRTLSLYLNMMGANYDELLKAWMTTEPVLARLAAENADKEKAKELLEPFLTTSEHSAELRAGISFHQIIGTLSDNPVIAFTFRAISLVVAEHVLLTNNNRKMLARTVDEHSNIAHAIIKGDSDKAEQLMREHVQAVVSNCRSLWPQKLSETIEWR